MEIPPNQTIYINNLNEKIKKDGKQFHWVKNVFIDWNELKTRMRSGVNCYRIFKHEIELSVVIVVLLFGLSVGRGLKQSVSLLVKAPQVFDI